ncbi:MAG: hypothetical protein OQJ98_01740 [Candidatus Pacebacteria bacterium]|nr:hypothetical protein [Candidatus Paceibacterota bacterium]
MAGNNTKVFQTPLAPGETATMNLGLGRTLRVVCHDDGTIEATEEFNSNLRCAILEGEQQEESPDEAAHFLVSNPLF